MTPSHSLEFFSGAVGVPHALLSSEPADRAVVFVHGFRGSASDTWTGFEERILTDARFATSDVYFFEYETMRQAIATSSELLYNNLKKILPSPREEYLVGTRTAAYQELVLVGHSLGGVVVRRCVLRHLGSLSAESSPIHELIRTAGVRLFAPAIGGVQVSGLKGLVGLFGLGVLRGASRTVDELAQGSATLTLLQTQTEDLWKNGMEAPSLSAEILWAGREDIVVSGYNYLCDPQGEVVIDADHKSVCKPLDEYGAPIELVHAGLAAVELS